MNYISHFRFVPHRSDPDFEQLTPEQYRQVRSHPDRPIKQRWFNRPSPELMDVCFESADLQHCDTNSSLSRNRMQAERRRFTLDREHTLKYIEFNGRGRPVASTGTSVLKRLCITHGMGPCIAVAIGGEKIVDGVCNPGAKVRIFHVFPRNNHIDETLRRYVQRLKEEGLTVKAAMYGGTEADASYNTAVSLQELLQKELELEIEFDEACEFREDDNLPLGAVILDDHSVQFVTELAQPDISNNDSDTSDHDSYRSDSGS